VRDLRTHPILVRRVRRRRTSLVISFTDQSMEPGSRNYANTALPLLVTTPLPKPVSIR
jgi:hypothetical protein